VTTPFPPAALCAEPPEKVCLLLLVFAVSPFVNDSNSLTLRGPPNKADTGYYERLLSLPCRHCTLTSSGTILPRIVPHFCHAIGGCSLDVPIGFGFISSFVSSCCVCGCQHGLLCGDRYMPENGAVAKKPTTLIHGEAAALLLVERRRCTSRGPRWPEGHFGVFWPMLS
jgi:hypothetical protein